MKLYCVCAGYRQPAAPESFKGAVIFSQTKEIPVAAGVTMDDIYAAAEDFDKCAAAVCARVTKALEESDVVFYTVAQPWDDAAARQCLRAAIDAGHQVEVKSHGSFPRALELACAVCPEGMRQGVTIIPATGFISALPDARRAWLVVEVANGLLASQVKLAAARIWGDTGLCRRILCLDGIVQIEEKQIFELDRGDFHPGVSFFFPALEMTLKAGFSADDLCEIMGFLRSKNGCPWDREQTHQSIRANMIEECFEALAAMDAGNMDEFCDELGDVLLQAVFHARIACEHGEFDWLDVTTAICSKLITRHPHVFGQSVVADANGVLIQWENIKASKEGKTLLEALEGASCQPGLTGIYKAASRLKRNEHDLPDAKFLENEYKTAREEWEGSPCGQTLGRLLWALGWLSDSLEIDGETALREYFRERLKTGIGGIFDMLP